MHLDAEDEVESIKDANIRRKARVKLLFQAESEKFIAFYRWLVILASIAVITVQAIVLSDNGSNFGCSDINNQWMFKACWMSSIIYFIHVFSTM